MHDSYFETSECACQFSLISIVKMACNLKAQKRIWKFQHVFPRNFPPLGQRGAHASFPRVVLLNLLFFSLACNFKRWKITFLFLLFSRDSEPLWLLRVAYLLIARHKLICTLLCYKGRHIMSRRNTKNFYKCKLNSHYDRKTCITEKLLHL